VNPLIFGTVEVHVTRQLAAEHLASSEPFKNTIKGYCSANKSALATVLQVI
jgi:hypothetical protein